MLRFALFVLGAFVVSVASASHVAAQSHGAVVVLDDFEADEVGRPPASWKFVTSSKEILPLSRVMSEREWFRVMEEDGNQFLRAYTEGEAQRITLRNGPDFSWSLGERPRLAWRWRAHELPEGASERNSDTNDTGAAVYVTFGTDWLGRPKSIKYTYSSTLPVGTVVSYGPLKVLVVDSGRERGTGQWQVVQRNVIADYRQLFGGAPPDEPVSITLWSDADTLGGTAVADFDDLALRPPLRR